MARPLVVRFAGMEIPLEIEKVERSDIYGYTEVETYDESGRRCTLATLGPDGKTLIGSGGLAGGFLGTDGRWLDKDDLTPITPEGEPIEPVPSSFAAPVEVTERATIVELLDHTIRAAYLITGGVASDALAAGLGNGAIFKFPFSYRGGLQADTAFLLQAADGSHFMLIGSPTTMEFVGLSQPAPVAEAEEEAAEEDDSLDFAMF